MVQRSYIIGIMRAIIYGATTTGKKIYQQIAGKYQISYFIDGNPKLWGHTVDGIEIKNPDEASVDDADIVFIGVILGYEEAVEIMMEKGFLEEQIITKFVDLSSRARRDNIEKIAVRCIRKISFFHHTFFRMGHPSQNKFHRCVLFQLIIRGGTEGNR